MSKKEMGHFPIMRYGYLCGFDGDYQGYTEESVKMHFVKSGWTEILNNLTEVLNKSPYVSNFHEKDRAHKEGHTCEGLIIKCPQNIVFDFNDKGLQICTTLKLSITVCKEPHLSKLWITFKGADALNLNGKNPAIVLDRLFSSLSEKIATIILSVYSKAIGYGLGFKHRINITSLSNSNIDFKLLIDEVNAGKIKVSERLKEGDDHIFALVKHLIEISLKKGSNIKIENAFFSWAIFKTFDGKMEGIFNKRHEAIKDMQVSYITGFVFGGQDEAQALSGSIIRTLAPFL